MGVDGIKVQGYKKHLKEGTLVEKLKWLVWKLIPYDLEVAIRAVLQPGFRKKHAACAERIGWEDTKKKAVLQKNKKISVVFFCHFPSIWNSSMSAFQAALEDPNLDVYLLALPPKMMEKNCKIFHEIYGENRTYEFCRKFFPDTINAFRPEDQSWFDLQELKPDYVFLSRPYDQEIQPGYQSKVLDSYTKICYIPYSYCKMKWDSRVVYGCDFMDHVYAVFTENPMYCRMVRRIFCGIFKSGWKHVQYVGYPRFDLHRSKKAETESPSKTVVWLPRWTTKNILEPSTFFLYKDVLLDYFKANPQFQLICRPHPLMFDNFRSTGEMTEAEIRAFKTLFVETENFCLDESGDYLPVFEAADIFISDTSSLLIEEFITGKPVIFCGSTAHFDREARKWAKLMYPVRERGGLMDTLKNLLDGHDPNRTARECFIGDNLRFDGGCGKRIIEFIKNDYFESTERRTSG